VWTPKLRITRVYDTFGQVDAKQGWPKRWYLSGGSRQAAAAFGERTARRFASHFHDAEAIVSAPAFPAGFLLIRSAGRWAPAVRFNVAQVKSTAI
jgi:hypothetical protein